MIGNSEIPQIKFQPAEPGNPFLLASDIDGTLIGDAEGEKWIKSLVATMGNHMHFAVITGRSLDSIMALVAEGRLPQPDIMVGAVGTVMVDLKDPDNALGKKYVRQVSSAWNLEEIYARGVGPGIQRQDFPGGQPPHQAGFYWDGEDESLTALYRRLTDLDQYHIQSSAGAYVDVLPHPLGKGYAAQFLQKELGVNPERVLVAGDSGNDQEMFSTHFKGVVPSNALDELKVVASEPWHYHSLYPAGQGVLDGLRHFSFIK